MCWLNSSPVRGGGREADARAKMCVHVGAWRDVKVVEERVSKAEMNVVAVL
jgi:hypothetical protein